MRKFTFKGALLTIILMLFGSLSLYATNDDLVTEQVTIKLDEAGTLAARIPKADKFRITNLKVVGDINGTDLKMLRIMSGGDSDSEGNKGNLFTLDLSDAKIVAGGEAYYDNPVWKKDDLGHFTDENYKFYTSDGILGKYSFAVCTKLKEIVLPSDITSIEEGTFSWCYDLEKVIIPSRVTSIGFGAFALDQKLPSLEIPSGVTSIGGLAFYGCRSLVKLDIPLGVVSIGGGAFFICTGLKEITLPPAIVSIEDDMFGGCINLTKLDVPSGVTSIGVNAFANCQNLTSLTIPSSVTTIDGGAFENCI